MFSNYKKVILDSQGFRIINSGANLEDFSSVIQFSQSKRSNLWIVNHNLNKQIEDLKIQVFINTDGKFVQVSSPYIQNITNTSFTINFFNTQEFGFVNVFYFGKIDTYEYSTPFPTPTVTQTITQTNTVTPTVTLTPTITQTISLTPTPSITVSETPSVTPSITASVTPTNTITPSPSTGSPASDPYFADVVSLLHFDGTNGSTTFTDQIATNTWTAFNGAEISSTQNKFGGTSGDFYTTQTKGISAPINLVLAADFTFECFAYFTSNTSIASYIFDTRDASNTGVPALLIQTNNTLSYFINGYIINTTAPTRNVWHHVALVRSGTTTTLYVDGISKGSAVNTQTYNIATITVGNAYVMGSFSGAYIDEFRITNGIARYTTTFTPPASAFPNS